MALPLVLPILSAVAPALISRLTGDPESPATRAAVAAVQAVTGSDPTTPEGRDMALAAIEADPALAMELRARLSEVALAETEALLADRADARAREVAIVEATGRASRRADVMLIAAFAAVVGIAGVMFLLSLGKTYENSALVNTLVGFLSGIGGMFARNIGTAFDYEFGSSRSSREKDERIAGIAAGGVAAPAAGALSPLGASALERLRASLRA